MRLYTLRNSPSKSIDITESYLDWERAGSSVRDFADVS
jgi:hypothetical protein